ncbi:MAG: ABC transporter ATP-binding protein [Coriobacteriia bacterium]|nr:ABC transporter ATP-binding protein [Coriobacteriia bacterium]
MSIEISNLDFSYGTKQVLRNLNLSINPAETLTILGPNGSGKTTFLSLVAGLLAPSGGSIVYDGKPFKAMSLRKMAQLVGYVPQILMPAFDYSVLDYVVTGCAPQIGSLGRPRQKHYDTALEAIQLLGIEHLTEKSYRQISGGERQQVSIARVLAQSPTYILMDEPTSHLDYGNQIRVLKTIKQLKEKGFGVVFTTHNPDQALLIEGKTAIIDRQGNLVFGDSSEMIDEEYLSELFGTQMRIARIEKKGRKVCYAASLNNEETEEAERVEEAELAEEAEMAEEAERVEEVELVEEMGADI